MNEPKRSLAQSALMWALLQDIANQLEWCVDGRLQKLSKEDWKVILTAGLTREQRIAQGINGGFVLLGSSTSKMSKAQMSELIEFIHWFCTEKGVVISAPAHYEAWAKSYRGH